MCDQNQVMANLRRFMSDLTRLSASNYIPTPEDMLCSTASKPESTSMIIGNARPVHRSITLVDRQGTFTTKCPHTMDNVRVVAFMVSLTCYDLALAENQNDVSGACRGPFYPC